MKVLNRFAVMACLLGAGLAGCTEKSEEYYVKHVEFPAGTSLEQKVDLAASVVPTPRQLEWQKREG